MDEGAHTFSLGKHHQDVIREFFWCLKGYQMDTETRWFVPCCCKYLARTMNRNSIETSPYTIRDLSFEPIELLSCGEHRLWYSQWLYTGYINGKTVGMLWWLLWFLYCHSRFLLYCTLHRWQQKRNSYGPMLPKHVSQIIKTAWDREWTQLNGRPDRSLGKFDSKVWNALS